MSFWSELKRRNVYKVAVAYLIAAWLILQVAAITFPALHLPGWALTLITVFIIVGFPLVLIFAWAFEITPEGLKLTKDVPKDESITHLTGRKLNYILIGVIILGVCYVLFDNLYLDKRAIQTEVESRVAELVPPPVDEEEAFKTIAVLPFENLSSDPEQEYFVDGLSEELLNCLAKISGLRVTSRTSSFFFKGTRKKLQDIADDLGVENILEGSVRKAGDKLRITAQLIRVKDDSHLWSNTYDRELKDIFAIQEDIAKAVSDELKATLGIGKSFKQLGGTDNVEAYEHYLFAQGLLKKTVGDPSEILTILNNALESIDAAIALDPEFALAWAYKALIHYYFVIFGPVNHIDSQREAQLHAAQKTIEIEPNLPEGHYITADILGKKGELIAAESELRKAFELETKPLSWANGVTMVTHYLSYGYFEKAQGLLEEIMQYDPLNLEVRGFYLLSLGLIGEVEEAEREYERGRALFGDRWLWGNVWISLLRLGTGHPITPEELPIFQIDNVICDAVKEHLKSPEEGIAALHQLYHNYPDEPTSRTFTSISYFAAYFGDFQLAMDTMEKDIEIVPMDFFQLWPSLFQEVRRLPRFKELVREYGLVDYWNEFGWPDICRPLDNGDFVCD